MLERNEKGKLFLRSLDLQIFLGNLYAECRNQHEVEWVQEQLSDAVECLAEERIEEL
ncbi:hypothetical protein CBC_0711 [Clostridium botulinum C str. Eklund]|uniref:hypothetical protein n=1 Tax=Clostridium botulinum TaxID=1491 RepID=UPI0001668A06|nr:hypothetical protein [Clostridium botulinum]EDS78067.1 hypothetical protein CBC_0711 [Clostridium botulinum C str. Eklund]KEH90452.1 hypothetical protein Z963_p0006 [Clostridium botulinum C/D str. It1]KEH91567.1 hypothetical protein Z962_p0094 [Clostridium botulinum C/D str. BKT12695]